jgi:hypothetical protein
MTEEGENVLWLEIWNEGGKAIHCRINTLEVNGNSLAVKSLDDYGWEQKESKIYQRREPKLVSLGDNWEENLNSLYAATNRLFKNGLGIRLD